MKTELNKYLLRMKSLSKKDYYKIGLAIAGLLIFVWFLSFLYGIWHESNLLNKYAKDPATKEFVELIIKDKQVLAENPKRAQMIGTTMDVGLEWYNLREYDLAIKWWKKGLSIEPNNDIGWYNLGNAYRELGKYSKAEGAYAESMDIAVPGEIDACLARGEMYKYLYTRKKDKEDDLYLKCMEKHGDNRDLVARLAIYYRDSGDKENAIKYFDKLFSMEPTQDVGEELRKLRIE